MPTSTPEDLFTQLSAGFGAERPASARRVSLAPPVVPREDSLAASARTTWGAPLPVATLVDIALGLAAAEVLWRPHVTHDPVSRTSVRLVATPGYEVWLLGWTAGQRVELHDHGRSNAAFVVLDGDLDELRLGPSGLRTVHRATGSVATVEAGVVHDVVNRSTRAATSLHVYADPLRTMTYFRADGSAAFSEIVQEVPALVTSEASARALHPGRLR